MAQPEELILKDVRCFGGEQRGRLRPITLLVGENSTGKSTFLACFSVMYQIVGPPDGATAYSPDFNREPFSMGSFRDIVRSRRGRRGRIEEFQLGIKFDRKRAAGVPMEVLITFEERGSQPVQSKCLYRYEPSDYVELRQSEYGTSCLSIPKLQEEIEIPFKTGRSELELLVHHSAFDRLGADLKKAIACIRDLQKESAGASRDFSLGRHGLWNLIHSSLVPVAPLRAKPKRTYDPVRETDSPGGEHIPMLMMRLHHSEKPRWRSLHEGLVRFGKDSGLYADVKVRRHGKQISDPFQLQVKVQSGSHSNIMDVGYGVSQSLPILVSLLSGEENSASDRPNGRADRTFLLQQPEVHLHPRGQAELAALFARVAQEGRNRFLIETHSDYIVDRMRILVRNKLLRPDDVSIIFFEPGRNAVKMHNIALDEFGNLKNAPSSYRSFFLKETDRLLGFDD